MPEFTNVTVVKAANSYFDGNVTSRTIIFADGSKKPWESCCRENTNLTPMPPS